ncbi:DUF4959 domain-containing protein [uncultured Proteiniphilum sp.]|uniref:DUF4959 domain-containing protein n=1 Tax=uncultured Proteiniphilum sp. TaxID=497637 RepID=UPI002626D889|nr:DUF4959 domain-containing protein [uncultured Proteiniphilum sp.]
MMKDIVFYLWLGIIALLLTNCEEEKFNVQYPTDQIPPQAVSNVEVVNMPGSVQITYELPDELDLMYVKAIYPLSSGGMGETKVSAFSNTMVIKGFGKSRKHLIELISVDKSLNESNPVKVEIEPMDSPIYEIFESMDVLTAFGGFTLKWENPLNENVLIEILESDTINNLYNFMDIVHSAQRDGIYSIRGLDTTMIKVAVFLKDPFENYTDTLEVGVKPYFEERIPTNNLTAFPIPPYFELFGAGRDHSLMFLDNPSNSTYIRAGNPYGYMPWFTVDLGLKAVFSRLVHFHRAGYEWTLHNMRELEVWGTNSAVTAAEHTRLPAEWREDPNWILLGHFKSVRPSGGEPGTAPTSEDMEFILAGEEFEFLLGQPSVQYLRFNIISTWSNSTGFQSPRVLLYGQVER